MNFAQAYGLNDELYALALAVGLTPELLPMVISVTLSRGAMRMAKKHMIVGPLGRSYEKSSPSALMSAIVEHSSDLVAVSYGRGKLVYVSPVCRSLLGMTTR